MPQQSITKIKKKRPSALVRGFKATAEKRSLELRSHLGLSPVAALSPFKLAAHLQIKVLLADQIPALSSAELKKLNQQCAPYWSAVTLSLGPKKLILLNHTHSSARQNSDLMHELAHLILAHTPTTLLQSSDSYFCLESFSAQNEAEAEWLGACLLLPRAALRECLKQKWSESKAMQEYGVSKEMLNFRMRVQGL